MPKTHAANGRCRIATALVMVLSMQMQAAGVYGQVCGDANDDQTVSVADGVSALRAAADLFAVCPPRLCDLDGSGAVSVTDGVGILRLAAELPASQACLATSSSPIDEVQSINGTHGTFGPLTKKPNPNAPTTISSAQNLNGSQASIGRSNTFVVDYDVTTTAGPNAVSQAANGSLPALIIAAERIGSTTMDAFTLPLTSLTGQEKIAVTFPSSLTRAVTFVIRFATVFNDELSQFTELEQTASDVPTCGDFTKDPNEECDPPGTVGDVCVSSFCDEQCKCAVQGECGNGVREGIERCDGTEDSLCQGKYCDPESCTCSEAFCGNDTRDGPDGAEECDGPDVTECTTGLCSTDCHCTSCGNNVRDPGEECDGTANAVCGSQPCLPDCVCAL